MNQISRQDLISLCEKAIVTEDKWSDRDSSSAILQIGQAWALLKAECPFEILTKGNLITDEHTIWIAVQYSNFMSFESWEDGPRPRKGKKNFYIPTHKTLEETIGKDWC